MRILFVIALGFASVAILAYTKPASAAAPKCVPVNCHVYHGSHGPVTTCDKRCTPTAQGVRVPQPIQQQKNKRMN